MPAGYYRFPSIHEDVIVFVCEDDLWTVPATGGVARRLTSGLAEASYPVLSPDGSRLAFTGREEGQSEAYVMPATGGPAHRLTYLGSSIFRTVNWNPDGQIVFTSNTNQPNARVLNLFNLSPEGGRPERLNIGLAATISYGSDGGRVIGRNTGSPERWKRYRGGTAGQIWIDAEGEGQFKPLVQLAGNLASPMWIVERIYFLSDHEGLANIYSCNPDGEDLKRHTDHNEYYARNAATDGKRVVYHAGGDIYLFDPAKDISEKVEIAFYSPQTQRNRKFVDPAHYLDSWSIHPKGHSIAVTTRGKAYSFANWEGAVLQHGKAAGPRYRLVEWLNDGERLVALTDESGEESFVIIPGDGKGDPEILEGLDIGRPISIEINPKKDQVLFSNHRYELCLLDLEERKVEIIDRGKVDRIAGFSWSPDGRWAAYGVSISTQVTALKLWNAESGDIHGLTAPLLWDFAPQFDPKGKYIYFLSHRYFDPVYDNMHFDLGFPRGEKPYLITLQADTPSPFIAVPHAPGEKPDGKEEDGKEDDDNEENNEDNSSENDADKESDDEEAENKGEDKDKLVEIDLEGIEKRIVSFPVEEGLYGRIMGIKDGRVIYTRYPVEGSMEKSWYPGSPPAKGKIFIYNFSEQKEELLISGVSSFTLSREGKTLGYRAGNRLRLLKAGSKPSKDAGRGAGRKSGWIDLRRVKVSVIPATEWRQMYREAWRLERDQFWSKNMSQVDWTAVYDRYFPLVDRVASRSEFSDLIWEMQGELGTSHNYEIGGDYRPEPFYAQGFLGAGYEFDDNNSRWKISEIVQGDPWDENSDSPLNGPGIEISVGDTLLAVNGRQLDELFSPAAALVNLAGQEVTLSVKSDDDEESRAVTVKALRSEVPARYRQWVESNRRYVHEKTGGKIGYVHIPDMGPSGYAEFHRGYLAEVDRLGLIIDVRFNGGGHVSELLLEKLSRRRIGYIATRWSDEAFPYPEASVLGPMVAITNEHAGSDGDIFSHGFKMLGLGPLIGKRTWGGVVGIYPRHLLVDGTVTTQAEFSFWFKDVGWGVENYGTDPDIEVDIRPQDYAKGIDPQMDRAIEEVLKALDETKPEVPPLDNRPDLSLPKLPK
ncbi:MAG: S41 family peptidase [Anaerolineae bacterium]|nr:MAG: S41 family peptidase [Anaerolineae bacterium]